MWTNQHRKICQRVERRYPRDMTDSEWAHFELLIPPAKPDPFLSRSLLFDILPDRMPGISNRPA
jgi:hypothetical protein